jgi:dienelactone hydrolase
VFTLTLLMLTPAARADLASLKASCKKTDAVDNRRSNAILIPYRFCNDGLPRVGGRTPNERVKRAVAVPEKYDGYAGLPDAVQPDPNAGADSDGFIGLDANVALPDRKRHPRPPGGYPLIVLLHGCCPGSKGEWHGRIDGGGEKWHYTDAWFAARGYVVLSYTSRGFVNADGRGSTGETQLGHRAYEVNDLQYLAGLLAEDPFFGVNPERVVVSGSSYGAGVAWLALTDPVWRSPRKRIKMELAAVAPKYGWSDLANALVPNGLYRQDELAPIDPDTATSRSPLGAAKRSLLADTYSSGVTLPQPVADAFACLGSTTPFTANPACPVVPGMLDSFIRERSAYFQERFFGRMAVNDNWRIPVFSAGSFSNQLYPLEEQRRMGTILRRFVSDYPIQEYYGDFGHHAQNKAKEWADLCQNNRHTCAFGEYKRGFNVRGSTASSTTTRSLQATRGRRGRGGTSSSHSRPAPRTPVGVGRSTSRASASKRAGSRTSPRTGGCSTSWAPGRRAPMCHRTRTPKRPTPSGARAPRTPARPAPASRPTIPARSPGTSR